jgi:hypothetical protein
MQGFGFKFFADLMEVDFLIPERHRLAPVPETDLLHAQDRRVEMTTYCDIFDGQYQMIDFVNFHFYPTTINK